MKLISGSSNPTLATSIAKNLGITELQAELGTFANNEKRVWIDDSVRGENVVLVQSFANNPDEHIMETLLLTDALERMGARHVNLVVPWMGYSLQDKVFRPGEPIGAKVVANLLSNAYIKRIFLLDLHNSSTPGFFSIPSHHIDAQPLFVRHLRETTDLSSAVVASPDFGGLKRARVFANELGLGLVNIDKHRDLESGEVTAVGLHGDVAGKTVIFFDDVILSGGTVVEGSRLVKDQGATRVIFMASHGNFIDGSIERMTDSAADSIITTNSIPQKPSAELPDNITVLDVGNVFAEEIKVWM